MTKFPFLLIILLHCISLGAEEINISEDNYSFKSNLKGFDRQSIHEAMSNSLKGIILRITGDSKVLELDVVKSAVLNPRIYVNEYQLITDDNLGLMQAVFSFNEESIRKFVEENKLPLWIGQNTKVLFYMPCLNSILIEPLIEDQKKEFCIKAQESLIKKAEFRSIIMVKPTLDFFETIVMNNSDFETLPLTLDNLALKYGLRNWLACYSEDRFGAPLTPILCQSNFSKDRISFDDSITSLVDNISYDSSFSLDVDQNLDISIVIKNIVDFKMFQEIQALLKSFLVINSYKLEVLKGRDAYFLISLNSSLSDFRKIINLSNNFLVIDGDLMTEQLTLEYFNN